MGKYASEYVKLVKSWKGRKESDNTHQYVIDLYNEHTPRARGYKVKYKDPWCATTVSAAAIKLGYTDIIPLECSCFYMIKKAQKMGIWVEADNHIPRPGDIVLYDWDDNGKGDNTGTPEHVGVVTEVHKDKGYFIVTEGNYSNSVKDRKLEIDGKYIRGFICPKYDDEPVVIPDTKPQEIKPKEGALKVDGEWGRDTTLKTQIVYGTMKDGEISHQTKSCKKYLPNCLTTSWEFDDTEKGSQLIRVIQTELQRLGYYKGKIDGLCGKGTVTAIQNFLNDRAFNCGEADGKMGEKTVKAWQRYINWALAKME